MFHYSFSGEQITEKEAYTCPKCGRKADDWQKTKYHGYTEITCFCTDCYVMWDFQEITEENYNYMLEHNA